MLSGIVRKSAVQDVDRAGIISKDCPTIAAGYQRRQRGIVVEGAIDGLQLATICEYGPTLNGGPVGKSQVGQVEVGALMVDEPHRAVALDHNAASGRTGNAKYGVGNCKLRADNDRAGDGE